MRCLQKEGLGFDPSTSKKKTSSQKCTTPVKETFLREGHKEKGKVVSGKATRGMPTLNKPKEFMPPSYVLRKTKDGEVYAKFVGPRNEETFLREGHKEKGKVVSGKATRGMPTLNKPKEFMPPSYVLRKTKDGEVYAKFVGPRNAFRFYAIWVPKTLVTNLRGPIAKMGASNQVLLVCR